MTELTLKLERPAKKSGGDRYYSEDLYTNGKPFVLYLPQEVSRPEGSIVEKFKLTIEET